MHCSMKVRLVVSASVLLAGIAGVIPVLAQFEAAPQTTGDPGGSRGRDNNVLTFDVAVDCRTFAGGPNRGDVSILNGKIFPPGTLPSGSASNDPIRPVNGVAPVGDFLGRGQHAFPFPPMIAAAYSSIPVDFVTQYFMFENGRTALTAEGYVLLRGQLPSEVLLSVTGGIGRLTGAAGQIHGAILGTNATGCPNARTTVHLVPGSVRGAWNN